jgi:hypothetical protein
MQHFRLRVCIRLRNSLEKLIHWTVFCIGPCPNGALEDTVSE